MTRQEEIHKAYKEHLLSEGMPQNGFEYGANWADEHPKNPWISVKDKMPKMEYFTMDGDFSAPVLTLSSDNSYNILIYCIVGGEKFWVYGYDGGKGDYDEITNVITHWMPIPELTKED